MRFIGTVLALALFLLVVYLTVSWIADGYFDANVFPDSLERESWAAPDSWSEWRDIFIVFMAAFWMLAGILAVVLIFALILLALAARRVLRENAAPALDSLKGSLDNLKGTTEFAGETVVSPIIRVYSVVRGVRTGIRAVGNLPDRIRRRKKRGRK